MKDKITVVGGGLAGSEAAYYLAKKGYNVRLTDIKPNAYTPAHKSADYGELVCSNSLKSNDVYGNACGTLKEEMRILGSFVIDCADKSRVPAGAALATVLAQLISMAACFAYTMIRYPDLRIRREDWNVGGGALLAHLKQGLPLGIQFSILAIGLIVMQGGVVRFDITESGVMVAGTPAQNGYNSANKIVNFLMSFYSGLASGILGFNAQNYGRRDFRRIRKGTLQSLIIMVIMYAFCLSTGMLLSIGGAYQYIFLSADKVSATSIMYGNTYLYIDISLYIILGFLIVIRSAVQGITRVGYVFFAGIAELISRVVICAFLPPLINGGPTDASASLASFAAVCFGDPGAWLLASAVLMIPAVKYIFKMKYPEAEK